MIGLPLSVGRHPSGGSAGKGSGWLAAAAALLVALCLACAGPARAQELVAVPATPPARVIDQTGTLDAADSAALEAKLAGFESTAGTQIVIFMVPTTQPEDIAAFAFRVADQWKIGRRNIGDGVLVVVAKNDRRVRIEVAKTLEGAVPDLAASQIIERAIKPAFVAGDYAGGLQAGVDQLMARIKGEALPLPAMPQAAQRAKGRQSGFNWESLAMFLFVGVPMAAGLLTRIFGRKLGALVTGGAVGGLAWLFSASLLLAGAAALITLVLVGVFGVGAGRSVLMGLPFGGSGAGGWGGGRGGGGGGGGFSSGGGGDFGGGGASGRW